MKKIVAFFLALSMAVVMLAGCGASQTPTTTEAPKAETKAFRTVQRDGQLAQSNFNCAFRCRNSVPYG